MEFADMTRSVLDRDRVLRGPSSAEGDRTTRPIHSEGTIIENQDSPNGQICRVQFGKDRTEKTIAARFARMTKL